MELFEALMRSHAATCSLLPLLHLTRRHYRHTSYTVTDSWSSAELWAVTCYHLLCDQSTAIISRGGESCCCFPCCGCSMNGDCKMGASSAIMGSGQIVRCLLWGFSQSLMAWYSCHYLCSFCGPYSVPNPAWIQRHPKIHLRHF